MIAFMTDPFLEKVRFINAVSVTNRSLAAATTYDCFSCAGTEKMIGETTGRGHQYI